MPEREAFMNIKTKTRIFALSAALLVLIAVGGFLLFGGGSIGKPQSEQPSAEQLQCGSGRRAYHGLARGLCGNLTRFGDHAVTLRNAEYVDAETGRTLMKIPEAMMLGDGIFVSLCLNEDKKPRFAYHRRREDKLFFRHSIAVRESCCADRLRSMGMRAFLGAKAPHDGPWLINSHCEHLSDCPFARGRRLCAAIL